MSVNGLSVDDVDLDNFDELDAMAMGIEINLLTVEEVRSKFAEFMAALNLAQGGRANIILRYLASFIFVNGAHKNIPDTRRVNVDTTWGELKTLTQFTDSNKSMRLRFCAPIMAALAEAHPNDERNFMFRVSSKWGVLDQFSNVPVRNRFFGGYYFDSGIPNGAALMLTLQKRIIALASGGNAAANTGV